MNYKNLKPGDIIINDEEKAKFIDRITKIENNIITIQPLLEKNSNTTPNITIKKEKYIPAIDNDKKKIRYTTPTRYVFEITEPDEKEKPYGRTTHKLTKKETSQITAYLL